MSQFESLITIWQWGAGLIALAFMLVWLFARRPVPYRLSIRLAMLVLVWPLTVLIAAAVLATIGAELWREARHDDFWRLP